MAMKIMAQTSSFPIATVLAKGKYFILFIVVASIFFLFNLLVQNLSLLKTSITHYSLNTTFVLFSSILKGSFLLLPLHSRILLLLISLLVGIVVMLIIFKIAAAKKQALAGTKAATLGALVGLAVPACAACGIGLLSIIGLGSVLLYLPWKGIEISVLSVFLLSVSAYQLNNSLKECNVCQIGLQQKKGRK